MTSGTPLGYFRDQYARSADPWGLATRWYERRKYACTLAALPEPRYRNAFEPGCSVGVLSRMLADRCESLLCADVVPAAIARAGANLRDCPHARVEHRAVPHDWPDESFDLIVVSELAYYFDAGTRALLWDSAAKSLDPGGTLLAVHWRPRVPDHRSNGDEVHDELARHAAFTHLSAMRDEDFRLDVYRRGDARSVATAEGLR
jgi:hypothetical protein